MHVDYNLQVANYVNIGIMGLIGLLPKFWHAKVLASQNIDEKLATILVS